MSKSCPVSQSTVFQSVGLHLGEECNLDRHGVQVERYIRNLESRYDTPHPSGVGFSPFIYLTMRKVEGLPRQCLQMF
jgi:hypothetical protein